MQYCIFAAVGKIAFGRARPPLFGDTTEFVDFASVAATWLYPYSGDDVCLKAMVWHLLIQAQGDAIRSVVAVGTDKRHPSSQS
jgi:hypothetical protein